VAEHGRQREDAARLENDVGVAKAGADENLVLPRFVDLDRLDGERRFRRARNGGGDLHGSSLPLGPFAGPDLVLRMEKRPPIFGAAVEINARC